jgi:hypothetical protein
MSGMPGCMIIVGDNQISIYISDENTIVSNRITTD